MAYSPEGAAVNRRQSLVSQLPASPPPLVLQTSDPYVQQRLQQWRQDLAHRESAQIEQLANCDAESISPSRTLSPRGPSYTNDILEEYYFESGDESTAPSGEYQGLAWP
ncbi:hypothetical protein N7466_011093 [Penicillium verhagenii]|uniref:uncharacterized protein n=1 Tax=Penicillium verhagenii TaxID=1562060 RepID=UPI0025459343|nr:uncharacterized protein N7466_011073 [Penicillium verhagenii]XP_057016214.1 uncharacterized protein N7466_011093 [Penicillium verhagenii]KAJ5917519.1 hypothetical protein N7466_011073 [Penicillium verhagenii]KAJ5917539.1 hypothetical protein N7466_011093 [Penicillium verhagenii]